MNGKYALSSLSLFMIIWIFVLLFPLNSNACLCDARSPKSSLTETESFELAAANQVNEEEGKKQPALEKFLIYFIIFTPVVLVTLVVGILVQIIKLTKNKE
ncbi:hypothetical protein D3H55_09545 [Bacillus salacetis]|uniref:Uncharacterized protein n=1 Tax=Bacillus salacetis TaxID=2315464 RepID=A0A3A1R3C3_9BACI|nr:hypothetical protein [Bacillus salacetis]RIW34744.1 hypothetical protein D3H55_09545 [Bacillus salacetis]